MSESEKSNIEFIHRYLAAISSGATGEELVQYFCADVVFEEFPNRISPNGARNDLEGMKVAAARGAKAVSSQSYDVLNAFAVGDTVVIETNWTGTLAVPIGTLATGDKMRARFAAFFEFRNGKICAQRNYDCFEPW